MQSGKRLIIGIFLLAFAATALAWWHQRNVGDRSLNYWGPENAWLVRRGERIELLDLRSSDPRNENSPPTGTATTLQVDGMPINVVRRADLTHARGILHARQALIVDASYDWAAPPLAVEQWDYAIRIEDPRGEVTLLFDMESEQMRQRESSQPLRLTNAGGFRTFFEEQFPPPAAGL